MAILPALAVLIACGGGGGSGYDGGAPSPEVPAATPQPDPEATPSPDPAGRASTLLRQGDRIDGGVEVTAIRSAALGEDGSIFALVTLADRGRARAILRRTSDGDWTRLFDRDTAPADVDLGTLSEPLVSDNGAVLFRAERREDGLAERLFLATSEGFRDLADLSGVEFVGDADIGPGGTVAFFVGRDCTTTEEGSDRCELEAIVADGDSVSPIDLGEIDLSSENPRSPQVRIGPGEVAYFSLRGSRDEPTLVRHQDGLVETALTADQELEGTALTRPEIEGVNSNEQLLLQAVLARDEPPRPSLLGVLDGGEFRVVASEAPEERGVVTGLRPFGFDDSGTVLYRATITRGEGEEADSIESLRLGDGERTIELATQEESFLKGDLDVLDIRAPRINTAGDVVFTARVGEVQISEAGLRTIVVDGTRVVLRRADGTVSVPVTTRGGEFGFFTSLDVTELGPDGEVLVIGEDVDQGQVLFRVPADS